VTSVLKYLKIKKNLTSSSGKYHNNHLKGQARILDICQQEKATGYFNLPGGTSLYESHIFSAQGIDLQFINVKLPPYQQNGAGFFPGLSIIDALMFNEVEKVIDMLS
jgi:hypothetical protein